LRWGGATGERTEGEGGAAGVGNGGVERVGGPRGAWARWSGGRGDGAGLERRIVCVGASGKGAGGDPDDGALWWWDMREF